MTARKQSAPKRGASRYQAPQKKPVPGWVWLVCGLLIGSFFTFLFNLEPGRDDIRREKEQARQPGPSRTTPSDANQPKYEFYTLLPESEIIVSPQTPVSPEEAARIDTQRAQAALAGQTPPPAPPIAGTDTRFFLQAGSFRKRNEADGLRAQLTLLGQNVQIESSTVRDEVWHRVMVGPFHTREQLNAAQKSLASNGFNNLLLQQRKTR